jgi:hypothetical protein
MRVAFCCCSLSFAASLARYFLLTYSNLTYYTEHGGAKKGEVVFKPNMTITVEQASVPHAPTDWSFVIRCTSGGSRSGKSDYHLELSAINEQVMKEWLAEIQRIVEDRTRMSKPTEGQSRERKKSKSNGGCSSKSKQDSSAAEGGELENRGAS